MPAPVSRLVAERMFTAAGDRLLLPGSYAGSKILVQLYDLCGKQINTLMISGEGAIRLHSRHVSIVRIRIIP